MRSWLLAGTAVLAYLPSLAGPFQFDDYNVIVNYPTVHGWDALFERAGSGVRAGLKASYTLNWTLDPGASGFHLVNIVLHALNAVLLFWIGNRLFPDKTITYQVRNYSFAAAALFALHPMQTEAVTYISGRSVSLMATFYLLALLAYLAQRPWPVSALLFVLALATRETAVTLPAALLLIEICRGTDWRTVASRQWPHWLLLAGAGMVILFNQRYLELITYGLGTRGVGDNLLTQVGGVSYLVWHLVGLQGLNIDPALPTLGEWTPLLAFQAILLLGLLAMGITSLGTRPWLAFGILWFFLQLAPTNSFVPRLDVANDRQVYLACWGLFFALCAQMAAIGLPRLAGGWALAAVALVFAGTSVARQLDYRDEITLWEASVRSSPWNARAHNNLGYAYYEAGRKREARREFETALILDRGEQKAKANLVLLDWR